MLIHVGLSVKQTHNPIMLHFMETHVFIWLSLTRYRILLAIAVIYSMLCCNFFLARNDIVINYLYSYLCNGISSFTIF